MLKCVDNIVYNVLKVGVDGLEIGFINMDFVFDGVGVVFDEYNVLLVNDDMKMVVVVVIDGIVFGFIIVENYVVFEFCFVLEF